MVYLLNTLPQHLLLFLILFTPLAFGSVHVWAYSIMSGTILLMLGLTLAGKLWKQGNLQWVKTPFNVVALILILFLFLQIVPINTKALRVFSPETVNIHEKLQPFLDREQTNRPVSISLNPHQSKNELIKLFAYLGVFFFIINQVRTRKQINRIIIAIILVGIFESLYGMGVRQSGTYKIWWWEHHMLGRARNPGTFINPNHLAGYLEMALLLTVGIFLGSGIWQKGSAGKKRTWRQTLLKLLPKENILNKTFLLGVSFAIMFLGLVFTASRGGMAAFLIGLIVIFILMSTRKRFKGANLIKFVLVPLLIFSGIFLNKERLDLVGMRYERFFSLKQHERMERFLAVQPLIQKFRLTGTGFGTFADVWPKYQAQHLDYSIRHLHNDWLEWLIETGAIGFSLLLILFFIYFYSSIRLWTQRKDYYTLGISMGVMSSSAAILIHSLYDFNLQIPANAFLFSVILGIGFVALHNQKHRGKEQIDFTYRTLTFNLKYRIILATFFGVLFLLGGKHIFHAFQVEALCPTQTNSTLKLGQNISLSKIHRSLELEPDNSECRMLSIKTQQDELKPNPQLNDKDHYLKQRIESIKTALRFRPTQSNYYLLLGNDYYQMSLWNPTIKMNGSIKPGRPTKTPFTLIPEPQKPF